MGISMGVYRVFTLKYRVCLQIWYLLQCTTIPIYFNWCFNGEITSGFGVHRIFRPRWFIFNESGCYCHVTFLDSRWFLTIFAKIKWLFSESMFFLRIEAHWTIQLDKWSTGHEWTWATESHEQSVERVWRRHVAIHVLLGSKIRHWNDD